MKIIIKYERYQMGEKLDADIEMSRDELSWLDRGDPDFRDEIRTWILDKVFRRKKEVGE